MKKILRHFVIDTFCLWSVSRIASGMHFDGGLLTLLLAGIAVTFVSVLAKPIINLLLLPLNLITFGLFRWVASAIIIYLVTLLVKDFRVGNFVFDGVQNSWISIPTMNFSGVYSYVAFSFLLSVFMSFIYWLIK